jgi:hypothetical protein
MRTMTPLFSDLAALPRQLQADGYVLLRPHDTAALCHTSVADLTALATSWNRLEPDNYLKDGGRYRRRRHACFIQNGSSLALQPQRAHWQPLEYNALHGGMRRMFAPVEEATLSSPAWRALITGLGAVCSAARGESTWFVEAHQFRIDTLDGIGRPTPEGAHRDGVDFVAVLLVGRHHIKGGETRVFEADGPNGKRFTLDQPFSLLLDDARVIHESTPIQPDGDDGYRDTLVLTWRAGAFQGE